LEYALGLSVEAVTVDPLNARSYSGLGFSHWYAGHAAEARTAFEKTVELAPEYPYCHLALAVLALSEGNPQAALAECKLELEGPFRLQGLAMAHRDLGQSLESDRALEELRDRFADEMAMQIAEVHASRGDTEFAIEWLERAYEQWDNGLVDLKVKPLLGSLRGESRFSLLVTKMGLPL
jgi:tetratricopeptide (TPR) repeat protein